jgi:hypothetical protein
MRIGFDELDFATMASAVGVLALRKKCASLPGRDVTAAPICRHGPPCTGGSTMAPPLAKRSQEMPKRAAVEESTGGL